jgi:hypothetical protein
MMQFNIHRILYDILHKLFSFIIFSLITHFHKIEFTIIKMVFHVSCKHVYFDIQNNYAIQKK